jgi:hypothetical protein
LLSYLAENFIQLDTPYNSSCSLDEEMMGVLISITKVGSNYECHFGALLTGHEPQEVVQFPIGCVLVNCLVPDSYQVPNFLFCPEDGREIVFPVLSLGIEYGWVPRKNKSQASLEQQWHPGYNASDD